VVRWPVGEPIALRPRLQAITLEVILRLVIGVRDPQSLARLRHLLGALLDLGNTVLFLATAIEPDISWYPPWRRFVAIRAEADELIHREIARHREDPSGDDILSLLVQASGDSLTDEELRDELMTLLIAGHETTATALAWAFERLTRHPRALARLREGDPAYLDAVIKETLRVRPVVMEVGRDITEDTRIGRWELRKGTRVMSSIALVQRSEESWPDAKAFRPERFLGGQPAPYAWIPFGGGPRRCIGASFATTEMAAIIPVVLKHFDLAPDRPEPERSLTRNVTQVPARGARVLLKPRAPRVAPTPTPAMRAPARG
jgi:cytochrome P450